MDWTKQYLDEGVNVNEAGFEEKPKGWDKGSIKKYNKTFTKKMKGDVKSKGFFDKCVEKMKDKMENPEGFCASLKDEAHGSTYWRGKDKSAKEVKKDVAQHHNVKEDTVIDYASKREKLRGMSKDQVKQILKTQSGESLADLDRKAKDAKASAERIKRFKKRQALKKQLRSSGGQDTVSDDDMLKFLKRAKKELDQVRKNEEVNWQQIKDAERKLNGLKSRAEKLKKEVQADAKRHHASVEARKKAHAKSQIKMRRLMIGAAIMSAIGLAIEWHKKRQIQKQKMKARKESLVVENFLQSLYTDNRSQAKEWRGANIPYGDEDDRPNLIRQCMTMEGNRQKINCLRKLRDQVAMNPYYQHRLDRFVDAITDTYEPTNQQGTIPGNEFKRGNVGEDL